MTPKQKRRKKMRERKLFKILSSIALIICLSIILIGCANKPKEKDNYKILWGKRCTEAGTQYSYVWFHTVYGPDQVKKEWCKNG